MQSTSKKKLLVDCQTLQPFKPADDVKFSNSGPKDLMLAHIFLSHSQSNVQKVPHGVENYFMKKNISDVKLLSTLKNITLIKVIATCMAAAYLTLTYSSSVLICLL